LVEEFDVDSSSKLSLTDRGQAYEASSSCFFTKMPFIAMTVIEDHLYNHPSLQTESFGHSGYNCATWRLWCWSWNT